MDWPDDLRLVFGVVGRSMAGKRLHPLLLKELPQGRGSILPDHEVELRHVPREAMHPGGSHYEIWISGSRWVNSSWTFRSGELDQLARASVDLP
jgi:hypothetical protein